ncbi:hypothetical protein [Streptomyces atroolivaceus]|uniref:hypothetical protein n=1 Tax=Streptomyces atroolivaceus TaxID=66869 RepID=UPI00379A539D
MTGTFPPSDRQPVLDGPSSVFVAGHACPSPQDGPSQGPERARLASAQVQAVTSPRRRGSGRYWSQNQRMLSRPR